MKYFIFNETDGIYASPVAMSCQDADAFITDFLMKYQRQGYYASVNGQIPVEEVKLVLEKAEPDEQ